MIQQPSYNVAVSHAYNDITQFLNTQVFLPNPIVSHPFINNFPLWPIVFAERINIPGIAPNGVKVQSMRRLPRQHYGSWLMVLPNPAIAVNIDQLDMWERFFPGTCPVNQKRQFGRVILHELGHIRCQPHLIQRAGVNNFAPAAHPRDEEGAWVYAFAVLALLMGDYAYTSWARRRRDDSPAIDI